MNLLIYAFCCYTVWKKCPSLHAHRWTIVILAIAFPGLFHLFAWGQTSGLALLCFTLAFLALENDRPLLAGLAIGSLIFKPQLGLAAAVVFVFARQWKVVAGAVMAAVLQLSVAWMHYGSEIMRNYWHTLTHVEEVLPLLEPRLYQTHSLRSFWSLLLPWPRVAFALYAISALAVLLFAIRVWKSGSPLSLRYSALLLATVLISPHLTVYDLIILAPAFLLLGDWALSHGDDESAPLLQQLLYFCYPLFLIGPLARMTHVQLSVVAMAALLGFAGESRRASSLCPKHSPREARRTRRSDEIQFLPCPPRGKRSKLEFAQDDKPKRNERASGNLFAHSCSL